MYKLTDLIQWKLAETKIYLDTKVHLYDLEDQLLLRGQFVEFDTLKELRRPELIRVANAWPGPRTRYCVEDIIADIEARNPRRKLIVNVDKSRSYVNHNEAEISIVEEKDGEWVQVPSSIPGFIVANNKAERTLNEEIKRTVSYLGKKYLPDLFEKEFIQERYDLVSFEIGRMQHVKGKNIAEIEVGIQKNMIATYPSMHEYWEKAIAPLLVDEKIAPASKKLALHGFLRDLSNTYEYVGDINLKKIQNTVHILQDMLNMAIKEPEKYSMNKNISYIELPNSKITAKDDKLIKAEQVYAKGILEGIVTNPHTIEAMHNHEIALKFRKGEQFKVKVEAEIEYT